MGGVQRSFDGWWFEGVQRSERVLKVFMRVFDRFEGR